MLANAMKFIYGGHDVKSANALKIIGGHEIHRSVFPMEKPEVKCHKMEKRNRKSKRDTNTYEKRVGY
ncbi:hypothetical protein M5689_003277 [Euphorbia peplus]|nr:hypothetical protein M5689_003277 [Euphorbia peplus]